LTVQMQRFCPLCDRSFVEGEAVLRCEGCGVMHHPGCWVTNGGCATHATHKSTPVAQAYTSATRPSAAEAPHPGEGIRVAATAVAASPAATAGLTTVSPQAPADPIIGATSHAVGGAPPPQFVHRTVPFEATTTPPIPPRRYVPPTGEVPGSTRPLPKIYGGHPLTRYWYVPAAAGLAVGVAFFVIWLASLFGGSDSTTDQPAVGVTVTGSQQNGAAPTTGPGSSATTAPTAATNGKFKLGDTLVVTGTGECLNVRTAPGTENAINICLKDGEEVTVTGGPQIAGDLQWWKVKTALGEGWAAESYLVKK
jgi:Prokaryotic RING finger family 1/Bacterial SH3 domain